MTPLVLDHRDSNHGVVNDPEENQIREPPHQRPARIPAGNHPTTRVGGDSEDLPLKFVNEVIPQIPASFVIVIPDMNEVGLDRRMILNPHFLRRFIMSA